MALERRDASQVCTYAPPQPPWSFVLTGGGIESTRVIPGTGIAGAGTMYLTGATATTSSVSVGDQFHLYLTSGMSLTEQTLFTVSYAEPPSGGNVRVYFYPNAQAAPDATMTVTSIPGPTCPRWLGSIGHVTNLKYSYTLPGGAEQMSCLLQVPAYYRTDAINPGRVVRIFRGGSCIWDGKLDEPVPSATGWTLSGHGAGTFGTDFLAVYSVWNSDDAVNKAIGRGLRWVNPGIGSGAGIWLSQQQDSGAQTITDHMNLITLGATGQTGTTFIGTSWYVYPSNGKNTLRVFGLPTAVNRLLVCTTPVARTVAADINVLWLKYQATPDVPATKTHVAIPATFALTSATVPASINLHGPMEAYQDISSGGVLTAAQAQAVGNGILAHYQRADFGGSFPVGPGQLMTLGGVPIDLGTEQAGNVVQLLATDDAFGGEVVAGPVTFIVGRYEYDDDTYTATITPYQSKQSSLATLIGDMYPRGRFGVYKKH